VLVFNFIILCLNTKNVVLNLDSKTDIIRPLKSEAKPDIQINPIRPINFLGLSSFEKGVIKNLSNLLNLVYDPNANIDYAEFSKLIDKIIKTRPDFHKNYLISLFFPERIKKLNVVFPFPQPTHTFVQEFDISILPSIQGTFLIQIVSPFMVDTTMGPNISNVYINTHPSLDGVSIGLPGNFQAQTVTQVAPLNINAYILQACKLSIRSQLQPEFISGKLYGSYEISTTNISLPDTSATNFEYLRKGFNAVEANLNEGLNTIYYPFDNSYLHFRSVNDTTNPPTNHRMNICGSGLPSSTVLTGISGFIAKIQFIWSVMPTFIASDFLKVDYNFKVSFIGNF